FLSRSEASGDSGNLSKANSRYASADITNVSSVASLPPDYVAWKDALSADSWEALEKFEPAYPGSLYAAVARLVTPHAAAYQRPTEALAGEASGAIALADLPKASITAIRAGLRSVDYSSEPDSGGAGQKLAA